MNDILNYAGKTCAVTGAASGMGKATAELLNSLGAKVYALDINQPDLDVEQFVPINLVSKESIDAAVAELPESIDHIFSCAGVAGTTYGGREFTELDVMTINYIGTRYLLDSLIGRLTENGSVAIIASTGGMRWQLRADLHLELAKTADFEAAQQWYTDNRDKLESTFTGVNFSYMMSKEALIVWMKHRAFELSAHGIRMNSISPAATDTPMSDDFAKNAAGLKGTHISQIGRASTPEEQARTLIFLNSGLAPYVSGQDVQVDYAFTVKGLHDLA